MNCPKCGGLTKVYDKRCHAIPYQKAGYDMRRRKCTNCGYKFVTKEVYIRRVDPVRG